MSYKSDPQECPVRVSRVFHKSVLQECPIRVSHKSVLQECLTRVSRKSDPQECPKRVSHKSVLQECHLDICSFSNVFAFGFVGSILFIICFPRQSLNVVLDLSLNLKLCDFGLTESMVGCPGFRKRKTRFCLKANVIVSVWRRERTSPRRTMAGHLDTWLRRLISVRHKCFQLAVAGFWRANRQTKVRSISSSITHWVHSAL